MKKKKVYKTVGSVSGMDLRQISRIMTEAGYEKVDSHQQVNNEVNKAIEFVIKYISKELGGNKRLREDIDLVSDSFHESFEEVLFKAYLELEQSE